MINAITERIKNRMNGETYDSVIMTELSQTVLDRIMLRVGVSDESSLPSLLYSIVVDASVKAWRRRYYEGINSETSVSISDSFVEDILNEYTKEFERFADSTSGTGSGRTVRFL